MTSTARSVQPRGLAADSRAAAVHAPRRHGWMLLVCGVLGLTMSGLLAIEKLEILINPRYQPSCNINPILSCGSVMITGQASAFGFPNPFLGLIGYPVVIATAVLVLARVGLPRWWWLGMTVCSVLSVVFLGWLTYQTLYRIGALCPYCLVVWALTPIIASASLACLTATASGPLRVIADWRWIILLAYDAVIILLIFLRFQTYWLSLL